MKKKQGGNTHKHTHIDENEARVRWRKDKLPMGKHIIGTQCSINWQRSGGISTNHEAMEPQMNKANWIPGYKIDTSLHCAVKIGLIRAWHFISTQPQQPHKLKKKKHTHKRIVHSFHKRIVHSFTFKRIVYFFKNASHTHSPLNASSIHFCKRIVHFFLQKKSRRPFIGPALTSLTHEQNTQITGPDNKKLHIHKINTTNIITRCWP